MPLSRQKNDLSSQLGFIVLLCYDFDRCHVFDYQIHKTESFVRSILAAETFAFGEIFDAAFSIATDSLSTRGLRFDIFMFTASLQPFYALDGGKITKERRLMTDIITIR